MKIIKEEITIEYKNEEELDKHVSDMVEHGYTLQKKWNGIDAAARNHVYAKYHVNRDGYIGESLYPLN